jgi:hypothetical protein
MRSGTQIDGIVLVLTATSRDRMLERIGPHQRPEIAHSALVNVVTRGLLGGAFCTPDDLPPTAAGVRLSDLDLPRDATVVAVVRNDRLVVPRGDTVLSTGDEVLVLTIAEAESAVRELLVRP